MECSGDADARAHGGARACADSGRSTLGRGSGAGGPQHCPDCELPKPKRWHRHPFYYLLRSPRSWITRWQAPRGGLVEQKMELKGDFRDHAPPLFGDVYAAYHPVVRSGWWTMGLLEMWAPRMKLVKQSVHLPCWNSFSWLPWRWRGACFGRTLDECWWSGLRYSRWARGVYAAGLGQEYQLPQWLVPVDSEVTHQDRIAGLCMMNFLAGVALSLVMGIFLTCGGCGCVNCGACYSCHAREKLRRRFNLPPACGMPPGVDDCLVHCFCYYCAVHQELRELVVRGIDGPGLHILDVLPNSYANAEGIEAQLEARRREFERFGAKPSCFHARGPSVYCPPDTPPQMQRMSRDGRSKCTLATNSAATTAGGPR